MTKMNVQDTRNFISCRLQSTNNISSELFSDKQKVKMKQKYKSCNR